MILLDTNIILRSKQSASLHYQEVTQKLIELVTSGEELCICPQIIYEFYVVATRPIDKNGLGLSTEIASNEIENITKTYTLLEDNKFVYHNWLELVSKHNVIGKTAHDTRIVALMKSYEIQKLYTLNKSDFRRFEPLITLI